MRRLVISIALLFGLAGPSLADGPADEKPTRREHEILRERPSGFWTSNKPAEGGAYRWRLLGIGCALLVVIAFLMVRMVKKANAFRAQQALSSHAKPRQDRPDQPAQPKPIVEPVVEAGEAGEPRDPPH